MFQFLIGKVKTQSMHVAGIALAQFQFLIGKVKTDRPGGGDEGLMPFQFLLGKVKTTIMKLIWIFIFRFNSS